MIFIDFCIFQGNFFQNCFPGSAHILQVEFLTVSHLPEVTAWWTQSDVDDAAIASAPNPAENLHTHPAKRNDTKTNQKIQNQTKKGPSEPKWCSLKERFRFVDHFLPLDAAIQNHAERGGDHYLPGNVGRPGPHTIQEKTWKSSAVAERKTKMSFFGVIFRYVQKNDRKMKKFPVAFSGRAGGRVPDPTFGAPLGPCSAGVNRALGALAVQYKPSAETEIIVFNSNSLLEENRAFPDCCSNS